MISFSVIALAEQKESSFLTSWFVLRIRNHDSFLFWGLRSVHQLDVRRLSGPWRSPKLADVVSLHVFCWWSRPHPCSPVSWESVDLITTQQTACGSSSGLLCNVGGWNFRPWTWLTAGLCACVGRVSFSVYSRCDSFIICSQLTSWNWWWSRTERPKQERLQWFQTRASHINLDPGEECWKNWTFEWKQLFLLAHFIAVNISVPAGSHRWFYCHL